MIKPIQMHAQEVSDASFVTPITGLMPLNCCQDIVLGMPCERTWGGNKASTA
jgi:hypothetical protein